MKKKSELTKADLFYIINSKESDDEIAQNVDCSKRIVASIRKDNPQEVTEPEDNTPNFIKSVKSTVNDGKSSVYVMTQGASDMVDELTKQKNTNKLPDTSDYIAKIYK